MRHTFKFIVQKRLKDVVLSTWPERDVMLTQLGPQALLQVSAVACARQARTGQDQVPVHFIQDFWHDTVPSLYIYS